MGAAAMDGAHVLREGDALVFDGLLDRAAAARLWRNVQPLLDDGVTSIDLHAVRALDSAGLALLAQVAAQAGGADIAGAPDGLIELCAAYRLDDRLGYADPDYADPA